MNIKILQRHDRRTRQEFAKLRASCAFAPYAFAPSHLRTYAPYLRALLTRLIYAPCAPFSRALRAMFVRL